jgi:hypothetical protein
MSQILKSLQLPVTGSTPSTPPSGFGAIYASGSNKFFYKNPSGTEFDLLKPNGFINILYYTGSGTGSGVTQTPTWSKPPAGLKYIEVCCVGAGGGGGSGRKAGPSVQGGTGGGGGAIVWATFDASILSSSYTITLGAGGAGGSGQTTTGNGLAGTSGGTSSFGTLVIARGGQGGIGGQSGGVKRAAGGLATSCTPSGYPYAYTGCNGATFANVPANPVFDAPNIFDVFISSADTLLSTGFNVSLGFGGGGGGVGGGASATVIASGSRGSSGYQFTTLITNGGNPGSGSIGQNATPPTNNMITTLLQFTGSTTTYGLGGGGHGGGYSATVNGGAGSNGGLYGAGGGGGSAFGAITALSSSGAGGSGSSGLCIVVEFY